MSVKLYAVLLSVSLASTSVFAQDAPASAFGATLGATFFTMPHIDKGIAFGAPGATSSSVGGGGVGATFGLSGGLSVGKFGAFGAAIGVSGFATIGQSNSTVVDTFTGPGTVTIGGYTTPANANVVLTTNSAPGNSAASAVITHTNPQGGGEAINVNNPVNAGGVVNDYAASIAAGANSFALGGVVTQQGAVNSAAAYAAVAASDGGVFFAAGDLTGLAITTNVRRNVVYTGADLSVAMSTNTGGMAIQGYAGPSYRLLDQSSKTTISVDIPEASPTATTFPTYSMARDEQLTSNYFGGVVGLNLSKPIADNMTFSLGVEGGVYYVHDNMEGRESYSIAGGALTSVPLTTVSNANGIGMEADGVAWSAKLAPSITVALASNRQLTFGGTVDYLSRVASVTRDGSVASATNTYSGTDDGTLNYSASSQTAHSLSFAPMWSFTPTVSYTGQF
ncbi:MAG: hypothetical protein JWP26_3247 [Devosia sp.]|uniref:hypothetical protein n=1 Tax=Devosia sp. TaxID=1871048 RepID=UPI00261A8B1D|nr:hypothetical protein [Devosia sp.]MDB5588277.1 hypothetical protein [Devosia sp.]